MKIGNEIFYQLYISTLDIKIQEAEKDLKLFKETLDNYKKILLSYKPYIDSQVSVHYRILVEFPASRVRGKLSERYIHEGKLYTKEAFLTYIRNHYSNLKRYKELKKHIQTLKNQRIDYRTYVKIVKKFNVKISKEIVERQYKFNLGFGLGSLMVRRKTVKNPHINWFESNKRKEQLLKQGKIPYYKEEHEKAIKEGKEYKGVKWLIYHPNNNIWIYHKVSKIRNYLFKLIRTDTGTTLKTILNDYKQRKNYNPDIFPFID